ncbi:MAG: glycosyltransferase family 4 protein [Rhizobium sp.]|nr:glycosyltransferase family 4 protein [Rhizobium sp.]
MIVFCHLLNDNSGSPRVLLSAINALAASNENSLLYVGSTGRGALDSANLTTRRYPYRRSRFRLLTLVALIWSQIRLYRMLDKAGDISPDAVIYVNTLLPFGAAIWARVRRRRLVWHLHEVSLSPAPLQWLLKTMASRFADLLIYVSDDHRRRLPTDPDRSVVIPNPVPNALRSKACEAPFWPRRSGLFRVLMLASPRDFKGVPEFLNLARSLTWRDDIAFDLVLNAEPEEIAQYLKNEPVPPNLHIYPRAHNPARFYAVADLVVNLSRVDAWIETFGLTIIEAFAFGVPVIAPPVGGPVEIVSDGDDGFLIDSRDLAGLSECVSRLASDPALCLRLSAAARRKAELYSEPAFATRLLTEIAQLRKKELRA